MKLTTRGPATAQAIRNRQDFTTHGALAARTTPQGVWDAGWLVGDDLDRFNRDRRNIDYVVTSYDTPIAWHAPDGWYKVKQKFSVTTSKHQGHLYLVGGAA